MKRQWLSKHGRSAGLVLAGVGAGMLGCGGWFHNILWIIFGTICLVFAVLGLIEDAEARMVEKLMADLERLSRARQKHGHQDQNP